MEPCTIWWVQRCLKCQARKNSRQTIRWPLFTIPLPNSPGVSSVLNTLGPCRSQLEEIVTSSSSRTASAAGRFAVTAAKFTAERITNSLVNSFIHLWGYSFTFLFDNELQFCTQLATAVYNFFGVHKLATSAYHPNGNGGVDRVNHSTAQILAMVCNKHQNGWDAHLSYVEYAYNNSFSAAIGLAPNEVHIGHLLHLLVTVSDRSYGGVRQSFDRDHLAYCDLDRERQQRAYELLRE